MTERRHSPLPAFTCAAITLLAFAVRIYHLTAQGLWADEIGMLRYATMPLGPLIAALATDEPHTPFHYLFIKGWIWTLGDADFLLRFPSAAASTLVVPAVYGVVRRAAGARPGLLAAALVASSQLLVWYGQEARVYAFLVLFAALATLRLRIALETPSPRAWTWYALALAMTLHAHYYGLALAAVHGLVVLVWPLRRAERARGIAALGAAGATFAAWLWYARDLTYPGWMQPVTLVEAAERAAWAFAAGTSIWPEQRWPLTAPFVLAALIGAACLLLARATRRRLDGLLLIGWALAPVALSYGIGAASDRGSFHERYVIAGAPGALALAAVGVAWLLCWTGPGTWARVRPPRAAAAAALGAASGGLLFAGLLGADAVALDQHFFDRHFFKEDLRGAAAYMADRAAPDDLLIASKGRAELYDRYARVRMPTLVSDEDWPDARLQGRVARPPGAPPRQVWLLPARPDSDAALVAWLDANAFRLDSQWFGQAPSTAWLEAEDPPFGDARAELGAADAPALSSTRSGVGLVARTGSQIVLASVDWRAPNATADLKESLRLVDAEGRTIAQVDRDLGRPEGATEWRGRSALRVPADVPGGRYAVRLGVYETDGPLAIRLADGTPEAVEWTLGEVDLPRPGRAAPELAEAEQPDNRAVGADLRLIGRDLPDGPVPAGGRASVVLHWQGLAADAFGPLGLGATRLALSGAAEGAPPEPAALAGAPRAAGGLLRDARELRLAADLPPGRHQLVLRAAGPSPKELSLGWIEVAAGAARPAVPPPAHPQEARLDSVRLVGYDLDGEMRPGGRVRLQLHWQADESAPPIEDDLSIFVHMATADERIVAQDDSRPCDGDCPTDGWAPGDAVLDPHTIDIPPDVAPGRYRLLVGLYDPRTGRRLARVDAPPPDQADRVLLGEVAIGP